VKADLTTFRPLAGPYTKAEAWMMEAVIADLRAGGIAHRIVPLGDDQVEVWRSSAGWRALEEAQP